MEQTTTPTTPTVADRFFEAFATLKAAHRTNTQRFCREMGVDKRNFYKKRKQVGDTSMTTAWLTYIVEQYGVSPLWLLTGAGSMFHADQRAGRPTPELLFRV